MLTLSFYSAVISNDGDDGDDDYEDAEDWNGDEVAFMLEYICFVMNSRVYVQKDRLADHQI